MIPSFSLAQLRHYARASVAHLDAPLLLIALAILSIGVLTIHSATFDDTDRSLTHATHAAVAFVFMWLIARTPPQSMMRLAPFLYLTGVVLLFGVLFFGVVINGSRRWLSLGFMRIQPSEILKIATPLMLAWYFHRHEGLLKIRHYVTASMLLLLPFALIAKQPDLGTALLVGAAGCYVLFLAGLPWKIILGLTTLAGAAAPFLWEMLHDYQKRRILTLIDPTSDPLGAGYHIIQATIAIGSGGFWGKGYLKGTQTHLEFIPEKHTDFILAVFSEEWGMIGNIVLIVLYFLLVLRGLMIAAAAQSSFARLLAGAVSLVLFTYAFVNIGMVSGILPVVGVPLPMLSYGGTALVTIFACIGILMSIQTHRMLMKK